MARLVFKARLETWKIENLFLCVFFSWKQIIESREKKRLNSWIKAESEIKCYDQKIFNVYKRCSRFSTHEERLDFYLRVSSIKFCSKISVNYYHMWLKQEGEIFIKKRRDWGRNLKKGNLQSLLKNVVKKFKWF